MGEGPKSKRLAITPIAVVTCTIRPFHCAHAITKATAPLAGVLATTLVLVCLFLLTKFRHSYFLAEGFENLGLGEVIVVRLCLTNQVHCEATRPVTGPERFKFGD